MGIDLADAVGLTPTLANGFHRRNAGAQPHPTGREACNYVTEVVNPKVYPAETDQEHQRCRPEDDGRPSPPGPKVLRHHASPDAGPGQRTTGKASSRGGPHVLVYLPPGLTGYGSVPPFGVVIEAGLG